MTPEDAAEHCKRLGEANAKLVWLERRASEIDLEIAKTKERIKEMHKHSADAYLVTEKAAQRDHDI